MASTNFTSTSAKSRIIESAICTAVALAILCIAASCGGSNPMTSIVGSAGKTVARLSSHPKGHASIHPGNSGGGNFLSAFFQANGPAPSLLPEAYEGTCNFAGITSAELSSGLVLLNVPNGGSECAGTGQALITGGGIGGFPNAGIPVALAGTITVLKVSVVTTANQSVKCIVTNGDVPVNDNDLVQPYYNFATNTGILGIGATQLPISCQVPVGAGDSAAKVSIDWSKI
jgi:hypothetical protein